MTVIFYDKGDHPAGFIGFRAARTVGNENDYRQKYFGLTEYSYNRAKSLAYELDEKWQLEADAVLHQARIEKVRGRGGEHIIANGLRASFLVERRLRGGELRTYINPGFMVKVPGYGRPDKAFRIGKAGYREAYRSAVDMFCLIHGYENDTKQVLLDKMPPVTVFTEKLARNLMKNGHEVDKHDLYDKLGVVLKGPDMRPELPAFER